MCQSKAGIQSATAENRRGKKKERKKDIETTAAKYKGIKTCDVDLLWLNAYTDRRSIVYIVPIRNDISIHTAIFAQQCL